MKKNATDATMLPWRNGPKTTLDDFYRENGFFPAFKPVKSKKHIMKFMVLKNAKVLPLRLRIVTMTGHWAKWQRNWAYDDDYNYFNEQAANYRNLYHPRNKTNVAKNAEGEWIDIDPKFDGGPGGRDYYDENNAYTYQWHVQHDIQGLIDFMGGREDFNKTLDQLFREPLGRSKYHFVQNFRMLQESSDNIPWATNPVFIFLICTIMQANPGKPKSGFVFCWMFGLRTIFLVFPEMKTVVE